MILEKEFVFDSAHFLPNVPPEHKCRRLHGHTYRVIVGVSGEINEKMGWLVDFGEVKRVVSPIIERLDHQLLNSIPGLENPTAENIAKFIFDIVKKDIDFVDFVKVYETPTSSCVYKGEGK